MSSIQRSNRKPHRGLSDYRAERRNLLSGDHNIIIDCKLAEEQGRPWVQDWKEEGGRYQVLCNEYGTLVHVTNMPDARSVMKDATNFCDECRRIELDRTPV